MITPEEVRKKAERKYRQVLRAHLEETQLFPMILRADLQTRDLAFREEVESVRKLVHHSRETRGCGYSLSFREVKTKDRGIQNRPERISFPSLADFLTFIEKNGEYARFVRDAGAILGRHPGLRQWCRENLSLILRYGGEWEDILHAADSIMKTGDRNFHPREVPLLLDTKFIETHRAAIDALLKAVYTAEATGPAATDAVLPSGFVVWCRWLDCEISFFGSELGLFPIREFAHMRPPAETIVVVENKLSYLRFPRLKAAMVVWGEGNAAPVLACARWMREKDILYWGDIDLDGLAILGRFREAFPCTRSLCMDTETLERHREYLVRDRNNLEGRTVDVGSSSWYPLLTGDEKKLADRLAATTAAGGKNRLEQERVEPEYLREALASFGHG